MRCLGGVQIPHFPPHAGMDKMAKSPPFQGGERGFKPLCQYQGEAPPAPLISLRRTAPIGAAFVVAARAARHFAQIVLLKYK